MSLKEDIKFNISEIFYSIQGEGTRAGLPCTFVRFQGCMLRCEWCDTPYALDIKQEEQLLSIKDIMAEIEKYGCKLITLTGGEPLYQSGIYEFITYLCDSGYEVTIETSGNILTDKVDERAINILDMKCPGSGMMKSNEYRNLEIIRKKDEVKFVITDEADYNWAKEIVKKYNLIEKTAAVLFSPVFGKIETQKLAEMILYDKINVRMQLQMHKFIWEPDKRGV